MFGGRPTLSLADLEGFDPRAPDRRPERRFCCPLCGTAKPIDETHRCLSLKVETGVWHCHRCDASGVLREKWTPLPRRARQRVVLRRAFALPERREEPPTEKAATLQARLKEARPQPLHGTPGAEYLAGRGIDPDLAHRAGVRWSANWYGRPAVLFPLRDPDGKLVAAHGRHADGRDPKAHTVGALRSGVFVTPGALEAAPLVVVEGPMCALTLALVGVPALALCGTDAPDWLPRRTAFRRVLVATDADDAGDRAAEKLAERLGSLGAECERLRPVGAKDWNDVLQAGGIDALRAALAPALPGDEVPDTCPCGAAVFGYTPDGRPYCAAHRAAVMAFRCPACGSVGHQHPGAPGCDRREVVSARRYPAPLGWRGTEDAWTAGALVAPLPGAEGGRDGSGRR